MNEYQKNELLDYFLNFFGECETEGELPTG